MRIFYFGLLLLTSLLWGGNFVVAKYIVGHASPVTLTTLRWLIAIGCLLPIVWWKERKLFPPRAALLPLLLMGITGVVLFNLFQFRALAETTASNAGLISTLNAISIAMFSSVFLKEKINPLQMGAMFLSLVGVIFVISKGNLSSILALHFNRGDLWMLGTVGVWGLYTVCSKWATTKTSPLMATMYAGIFGVGMLLPFSVQNFSMQASPSFISAMIYTGLVSTVLCMVFWNLGIQKLGATTAGIILNFNPIFTGILAFIFLGEQLTWSQALGSTIVIIGCYFFGYFKKRTLTKRSLIAA